MADLDFIDAADDVASQDDEKLRKLARMGYIPDYVAEEMSAKRQARREAGGSQAYSRFSTTPGQSAGWLDTASVIFLLLMMVGTIIGCVLVVILYS